MRMDGCSWRWEGTCDGWEGTCDGWSRFDCFSIHSRPLGSLLRKEAGDFLLGKDACDLLAALAS